MTYKVKTGGKWLPAVTNLNDYAGIKGKAITDIAIKVSKGSVKYRVHIKGGSWLPYVTGYNTNDSNNGYAGNGKAIDAIEVYYTTPSDVIKSVGYLKAKYRVSTLNNNYYIVRNNDNQEGIIDQEANIVIDFQDNVIADYNGYYLTYINTFKVNFKNLPTNNTNI